MELAVVNQKFRKVEEARSPRVTKDSSMKNTQTENTFFLLKYAVSLERADIVVGRG